jgi:hypothetical protein
MIREERLLKVILAHTSLRRALYLLKKTTLSFSK